MTEGDKQKFENTIKKESTMIRIVHLSDFHLNRKFIKDWKVYVKNAMIEKLKSFHAKHPISFIAFTGDIIDAGGSDLENATKGFSIFHEEVVSPLLEEFGLKKNEFLMIPGNHDVVRTLDERREELGNKEYFAESYSNVQEFMSKRIQDSDFLGMQRIKPYKDFEFEFYKDMPEAQLSIFGSSFRLVENNKTVGVCCLNSAWRCYDESDSGKIIIGEDELAKNLDFVSKCNIKIALLHHPIDWLVEFERNTILNHISKDFDMLLLGHVHEGKTTFQTGFTGKLFVNIAPSGLNNIRSDSRKYSNGFTIIDLDVDIKQLICHHFRYNHDAKSFTANTDLGNEGISEFSIPSVKTKRNIELEQDLLNNIKEDHFKLIDDHLIHSKAARPGQSIKDVFIMPPISDNVSTNNDDEIVDDLGITDIVKSRSNLIFFGDQESGKTTLLFRLVREFVDEYSFFNKIPVYIDFIEMENKEVITLIKEYLRCSTSDAKSLAAGGQIVLLVDNLNGNEYLLTDQRKKLHVFNSEYEVVQIISSAEASSAGILPTRYIESNRIAFKHYFIKSLKAREIRHIIKQWMPEENEINSDLRLEKLVNSFTSYALPSSVMSVSLFLWSMEYSDRKPINHAVLMEIYLEILLEKLSKENVYRESFDFTNKVHLLAKIAQEMLFSNQSNYSLLFSEFIGVIEKYLSEVGFHFDVNIIANYFIDRKIFIKFNNRVKFTYSCFFHFFLAKRMIFNSDLKNHILDKNEYFKYSKEIDYYSGLVRNDESLLDEVVNRLEEAFAHTDFIFEQVDIDLYFSETGIEVDENNHSGIKNIDIKKIKENRPSREQVEAFFDQRLKRIPDPKSIQKRIPSVSLEGILIITANVLRNSEGVENRQLKERAYAKQVKYSLIWMVLYREYLIDYVIKNNTLPPSVLSSSQLDFMIRTLPLGVQQGMNKHMGTPKLSQIILKKMDSDLKSNSTSEVETFLSVGLYADIEGPDFPKYLKKLVKKLKRNAIRRFLFLKLIEYYYRRTRSGSPNEKIYLDLLTELRIRTQKLPQRMKMRVKKALEDGKNAFQKGR